MKAAELRASILQEAISGRLVPQDSSEGTAEDLLKEIVKEREALVKAGKIKKEKPLPEITEGEIPFDIPKTWKWVRLSDISSNEQNSIADGPFGSDLNTDHYILSPEVRVIQLRNLGDGFWKNEFKVYTSYEKADSMLRCNAKVGDIIIAKMMPAGRASLLPPVNDRFILCSDAVKFIPHPSISSAYLVYYMNSKCFRNLIVDNVSGMTRKRTSVNKLRRALIPLPPFAEQKRIVSKIEELMPFIDAYGEEEEKLSSISSKFPEDIYTSILQEAISGRLVPQDSSEGTAEDLLKEIVKEREALVKAGKIKKEKPLPEITEGEIPFDIPKTWKWVRLVDICSLKSGSQFNNFEDSDSNSIPYIKVSDMNIPENLDAVCTSLHFISLSDCTKQIIPKNAIIFPKRGGAIFTNKKRITVSDVCLDSNMMALIPTKLIYLNYIYYYLKTIDFKQLSDGSAVPQINNEDLYPLIFPLPPFAEQKRIVAKIEELLNIIGKI